jgi:hypothetical protein
LTFLGVVVVVVVVVMVVVVLVVVLQSAPALQQLRALTLRLLP